MEIKSKIFIAGHKGLVGSALLRRLNSEGYESLLFCSHDDLDLTQQSDVEKFFKSEKPEYVFLAAAKVGGIWANKRYPAEFIYSNLAIQINVLHAAKKIGVKRLIFLGSSCIYPRECPQPMKEDYLLTGPLEPTNQPYALAKIAGIIQCEAYNRQYKTRFLAVMPTNLYGPNDNFDLEDSHVLPALIRKFHLAKLAVVGDRNGVLKDESIFGSIPPDLKRSITAISVHNGHKPIFNDYKPEPDNTSIELWGTGHPRREFLHVNDLAEGCVFLMNLPDDKYDNLLCTNSYPSINIGCGEDITIKELSDIVKDIVGYKGTVKWDDSKPDGTPRKLLDISKLNNLGWSDSIKLKEGIKNTYEWYVKKQKK